MMKQTDASNRAAKLLNEFDQLENIQPSPDWDQQLLNRLSAPRMGTQMKYRQTSYLVVITCFLLVNLFFFLKVSNQEETKTTRHFDALRHISDELLINETASK